MCLIYLYAFTIPCSQISERSVVFDCHVVDCDGSSITVYVAYDALPADNVLLELPDGWDAEQIHRGDAFRLNATVSYCQDLSRNAERIFLSGTINSAAATDYSAPAHFILLESIRTKCAGMLQKYIGGREASLAQALILGRRESLPPDVYNAFKGAGISHMLALSGLHFAVVIALFRMILNLTPLGSRSRCVLTALAALAYMILVCSSPSVQRAAVFTFLSLMAEFVRRRADSFTTLNAAFALLLAINPFVIGSLSFVMSFLGAAGVIYASNTADKVRLNEKICKKLPHAACSAIQGTITAARTTFYASCFTMPVTVFFFSQASFAAPLSNIVAAFPCTLSLELSILTLVFSFLMPAAAPVLGAAAHFMCGLLMNIAEQLASTGLFLTNTGSGAADIAAGALSVSLLALLITNERFEKIVRASFYISLAFLICSILPGALT